MATGPDPLFQLRNNFYLGAYQAAINSSDIPNLSPDDALERDSLVFRSYIALGSYELVISEIDSNAPTPLQAVKYLALYLSDPVHKEPTITKLRELLADPALVNNPILRLIAGIVFMHEQDYNEALKYTHAGGTMELTFVTKMDEGVKGSDLRSDTNQLRSTYKNGKWWSRDYILYHLLQQLLEANFFPSALDFCKFDSKLHCSCSCNVVELGFVM
ncbi:hypothetical protein RJ641_001658 [Dillenia turbinata]|uniref:Coatomer subunit epsilon n=1 Tax=Dillenia turbinata TaxID=194707 RepID=A0AAN8VEH3_9MAGN